MLTELKELRGLQANHRLSAEQLAALRLSKLRAVLEHASQHVPFYRSLWKQDGVAPDDLRSLEDLCRWPIVKKTQLKRAGVEAQAGGSENPGDVTIRTSGSTGDVFEVKLTPAEHRTRLLNEFRTLLAMGFRPWDKLAAECPSHRGLHVTADHVIVECVEEDWMGEQDHGSVVVTTLNAFRMPLIRYRLGDLSHALDESCPCGCAFPRIEAPVGRADDVMVLPSNRILGAWQLVVTARGFRELDQFRYLQHTRDRLELAVVVKSEWSDERQNELRSQLHHLIGEPVDLEIKRVDALETAGTKFRTFFSHVQIPR